MNILWRLKICLKKKGWNDRLSNAQKLQTDNSATACAITDNQSRYYSGIVACPFSVAPGSTATVVVVSCSRVRSKEGGRVRQGGEVSLDTSLLKSRAEKRNVLWVGLREVGRVHQSAEVSLDTNSSLKSRAEKRNVL